MAARSGNGVRPRWKRRAALAALTALLFPSLGHAASATETCPHPMARVVSVQGMVEVRRMRGTGWDVIGVAGQVCHGDRIRVSDNGRAALVLNNDILVRLDQRSTVTFAGPPQDAPSLLELCRGALHFITRFPKPVRVITPFLNAAVEGTEFAINDGQKDTLTVIEGRVSAVNSADRTMPQTCEALPEGVLTAGGGRAVLGAGQTVSIVPGVAPEPRLVVRQTDAVQWALYYPPIIDLPTPPGSAPWAESLRLHRAGKVAEALDAALKLGEKVDDGRFYFWRAGLLLHVGRVKEAGGDIDRALGRKGHEADAQALLAIIAVVRGEKDTALELARSAVKSRPGSATAHISLSYASQAHFRIADALASARRAAELDPGSGLAWARVAELELSAGNLQAGQTAAQRAAAAAPNLSRAQTILGFAYLTRIDTRSAKETFGSAIKMDDADPLPRLGIGLALIREGKLKEGRAEIEIAASLDPGNALVRSYLGKAYYEEKRDDIARTEFDLSKALDPNDPTPWFYDAILSQSQLRPGAAIQSLEKAIDLNDNRGVFRSRLLLDRDRAARGISLGRSYQELGLESLAVGEAASSLAQHPADFSAHRLLSDVYQTRDRHELARGSELLQSQLMQPVNPTPVQPRLAFGNLALIPGAGIRPGLNEMTSLFERDRVQLLLSGQLGNLGTSSSEGIVTAQKGRVLVNAGHYRYDTRGFRENNDLRHEISTGFAQFDVTPNFSVQVEYRKRHSESGDLQLNFDPNVFLPLNRNFITHRAGRIGAAATLSENSKLLFNVIDAKRDGHAVIPDPTFLNIDFKTLDDGRQYEAAYAYSGSRVRLYSGLRGLRVSTTVQTSLDFTPLFGVACFPPPFPPCDTTVSARKKEDTAYAYATIEPLTGLDLTLGVTRYAVGVGTFEWNRWSPKLGLRFQPTSDTVLRLAFAETIKPFLAVNETIEPTQVSGINQFFDDANLAKSKRRAIALDHRLSAQHYVGIAASGRRVKTPNFDGNFNLTVFDSVRERLHEGYLAWMPSSDTTIKASLSYEAFRRNAGDTLGDEPLQVRTWILPVTIHQSVSGVFFGSLTLTNVWHNVARLPESMVAAGRDSFSLFDIALGARLPQRRGFVRLEVRNALNDKFSFHDVSFFSAEPKNPRFIPTRVIMLSIAATL